jgi:hypothetical protein
MIEFASIDRRKFLRLGAVLVPLVAAGCDGGDGSGEKITTPPAPGGNRKRLENRAAEAAPPTGKKKK